MSQITDKPEAGKLGWTPGETNRLYEGKTFVLRSDKVQVGDKELNYEYEERSAAVIIVPVTPAGEIVLIRQYRYPVDEWCMEIPAGGCHDTGDLPLDEVVRRELREEIGAEVGAVEQIGWFYSAPSFANEKAWIFIAWDTALAAPPKAEQTEEIRTRVLPAAEAFACARSGEMVTAPCALALLRCEAAIVARIR